MGRRHLTEDERVAIIESYCNGEKMKVIAIVFDINEKTAYRICRKADVPIRWHRNCRNVTVRLQRHDPRFL